MARDLTSGVGNADRMILMPTADSEKSAPLIPKGEASGKPAVGASLMPDALLFAGGGLVDVEGGTGEDRVVVGFFAEERRKANIDFVGLAESGGGVGVVA